LDTRYYTYDNLVLYNAPSYQTRNAATAVYMFDRLFHERDKAEKCEVIREGLKRFSMPGRFQYLKENVILDGAHNEDAVKELLESLRERYDNLGSMKKRLVFAIASDKDYEKVIKELAFGLRPAAVYITELQSGRKLDKKKAGDVFVEKLGDKVSVSYYDSAKEAYAAAEKDLSKDELLIVAGSLYMAGELLKKD
jgi:Folylpolyglutamate synthase